MSILIIVAALVLIGLGGLRVANQYERAVVFRLGRYQRLCGPGLVGARSLKSSAIPFWGLGKMKNQATPLRAVAPGLHDRPRRINFGHTRG